MAIPSVMTHSFAQVPQADIPRSSFNRSHGHKTTFDAGYLIPVFVDEALPGDTFNLNMTAFARLATPIHPVMDNIFLDSFFFSVPMRLLWDDFKKFNGERRDPDDSTDFLIPQVSVPKDADPLFDYFGIPPLHQSVTVSALFFRAYNLIYNEWFRDQNLQDSVDVPTGSGPDNSNIYRLLRRGKRHDYFTSCLPWPQKGDPVSLPLVGDAPVLGIGMLPTFNHNAMFNPVIDSAGDNQQYEYSALIGDRGDGFSDYSMWIEGQVSPTRPNIRADLSDVTAIAINELRQAFQFQRLYERDARGGTRYTEIIKSHFGVTSDDARLQRPEYLGGGSSPVYITPITQTSSTDATSPQGNLAAMGTVTVNGHGFTKSFTEHCIVIGLVSARADLTYQQGINRMFDRKTRWDFYWPGLAHIGEQAVLRREIYAYGAPSLDSIVFGYQERYAEYRYKPSLITGKFRSSAPDSLDVWHLSQDFETPPTLSAYFIEERPPINRVVAVTNQPHFLFDSYFKLICARPMPVYGVPGLIDHF